MPSLADIPEHLRKPETKPAFIEWVLELAIDFSTARSLVHLWTRLTRTTLTHDEWLQIESKKKGTKRA